MGRDDSDLVCSCSADHINYVRQSRYWQVLPQTLDLPTVRPRANKLTNEHLIPMLYKLFTVC